MNLFFIRSVLVDLIGCQCFLLYGGQKKIIIKINKKQCFCGELSSAGEACILCV